MIQLLRAWSLNYSYIKLLPLVSGVNGPALLYPDASALNYFTVSAQLVQDVYIN